jgi:2-keto-4-pentenoate hydratase/2-oxohepta-3-ene-1,7-dioic acid hydratase in catechol pathway
LKFVRYEAAGQLEYGIVEDDRVRRITPSPFEEYETSGHTRPLSEVKVLAPCTPAIIFFMGGNYYDHIGDSAPPEVPQVYTKTSNSIIGPGDTIVLPREAGGVEEEGELVAIIGKQCKGVSKEDALDYVLGYTCGNDVSAREWQRSDPTFWRAKASDTFSPIGPYIVPGLDPNNIEIFARVNGKQVQHVKTTDIIHDTATCISYISQWVTLGPGDVIFTGTGGHQPKLNHGDVVDIEIPEIGVLSNPVVIK